MTTYSRIQRMHTNYGKKNKHLQINSNSKKWNECGVQNIFCLIEVLDSVSDIMQVIKLVLIDYKQGYYK